MLANFKARIIFKYRQRKKKEEEKAKEQARLEAELAGMPTPAEETAGKWKPTTKSCTAGLLPVSHVRGAWCVLA